MKFVPQRYTGDCGLAVAATVSHWPYERVREAARQAGLQSTSIIGMTGILRLCTGATWAGGRRDVILPLAEQPTVIDSAEPMVLQLRDPANDDQHWVAAGREWIFCPAEWTPFSLSIYPRRHWLLVRILAPTPLP